MGRTFWPVFTLYRLAAFAAALRPVGVFGLSSR